MPGMLTTAQTFLAPLKNAVSIHLFSECQIFALELWYNYFVIDEWKIGHTRLHIVPDISTTCLTLHIS